MQRYINLPRLRKQRPRVRYYNGEGLGVPKSKFPSLPLRSLPYSLAELLGIYYFFSLRVGPLPSWKQALKWSCSIGYLATVLAECLSHLSRSRSLQGSPFLPHEKVLSSFTGTSAFPEESSAARPTRVCLLAKLASKKVHPPRSAQLFSPLAAGNSVGAVPLRSWCRREWSRVRLDCILVVICAKTISWTLVRTRSIERPFLWSNLKPTQNRHVEVRTCKVRSLL